MDSKGWWVKILPKIADVKPADMDDFFFKNTEKKILEESGLLKIYQNNQIQLFFGQFVTKLAQK